MWLPLTIGVVFYKNTNFITGALPKSKTSPHSQPKSHVHFYYFLSIQPLLGNFPNLKFLLPANAVCEGYVFTGVLSVHRRGVLAPLHAGIHPQAHTPGRHPTGGHTPPRQTPHPLGRHPTLHSACWDMVNKQAVCIPLECILVFHEFG